MEDEKESIQIWRKSTCAAIMDGACRVENCTLLRTKEATAARKWVVAVTAGGGARGQFAKIFPNPSPGGTSREGGVPPPPPQKPPLGSRDMFGLDVGLRLV